MTNTKKCKHACRTRFANDLHDRIVDAAHSFCGEPWDGSAMYFPHESSFFTRSCPVLGKCNRAWQAGAAANDANPPMAGKRGPQSEE